MKHRYAVETPYGTEATFEYESEAIQFIIDRRLVGIARIRTTY